jgi:hypothetical protein
VPIAHTIVLCISGEEENLVVVFTYRGFFEPAYEGLNMRPTAIPLPHSLGVGVVAAFICQNPGILEVYLHLIFSSWEDAPVAHGYNAKKCPLGGAKVWEETPRDG